MPIDIDISDQDGLQWEGGGYLHRVRATPPVQLPADVRTDPTQAFARILAEAKSGDFRHIDLLFDVYHATTESDPKLGYLAILLLGDAGTPESYERMKREMHPAPADYELIIDYCNALSMRGLLADVPILLQAYRDCVYVQDAEIIPTFISDIMDPIAGKISEGATEAEFDEYAELVNARYQVLREEHGTEQVLLLKGALFSPRALVHLITDRMREPYFDLDLRRRFEAMSGLDCSSGFKNGRIQPLAMAVLLERFIADQTDSPDLDANRRLFFSHHI